MGDHAVLVEVEDTAAAIALHAAARAAGIRAREMVPGACTVLFDGIGDDRERLADLRLDAVLIAAAEVVLPTTYDGPDLESTADLLGLSPDALIEQHAAATYTVAFCGFAPGFAYCTGFAHDVPRLPSPRPRVEPGSVGLAGPFTGVYPSASPGGWRLIGRTEADLWDLGRDQPALLTPGTRVRFEPR